MSNYPRHYENSAAVAAKRTDLFAYLDDPLRLSGHMSQSPWQMGGGKMTIVLDGEGWKRVGATARMSGAAFGVPLHLRARIVEYIPPERKVWETMEEPMLLVIGRYEMGVELIPQGDCTVLRIFINFTLPESWPFRWFGALLGDAYARWCVNSMLRDTMACFTHKSGG